jgi:hypothetical protein
MSHKTKAYQEASAHGITITNYATSQRGEMYGDISINLPSGYQIAVDDDRTGLTAEGCGATINHFWKLVREDLHELISRKDEWTLIGNDLIR